MRSSAGDERIGCVAREDGGRVTLMGTAVALFLCVSASMGQTCPTAPCSTAADCNDGRFCTTDQCVGSSCFCLHSDGQCDDNNYCDGENYCDANTDACAEGPPISCNSPEFCSNVFEACVECETSAQCTTPLRCSSSGECVQCTSSNQCQDGAFCNGFETCNTTTGSCEPGTPVSCPKTCFRGTNPGAACTTDSNCGAGGKCLGFCSDIHAACVQCDSTGPRVCEGGANHGQTCTSSANCPSGTCAASCSDAAYCNGAEQCVNNVCQAGTAPNCKTCVGGINDGLGCSTDQDCPGSVSPPIPAGTCTGPAGFCDEANDRCQECLTNPHCDDGLFCTRDECTPYQGGLRICNNAPDPSFCDNGLACDGEEGCNASLTGCEPGTPPDCGPTCYRGATPGAACTNDTSCGKACVGVSPTMACTTDANCPKTCLGGTDDGATCATAADCSSEVCQQVPCAPGKCLGHCSDEPPFHGCVQCETSAVCGDALFCDGTETCNSSGQCVAGSRVNCGASGDNTCSAGFCNETTDQCSSQAINNGQSCSDGDWCTASSECSNGSCVNDPPAANDPYRCIRLELRPSTTQTLTIGSTAILSLYAVADGCNTPSSECPTTSHPIAGMEVLLEWDEAYLQLQPSIPQNRNPQDPCDNSSPCYVCNGKCTGGTRNGLACDNVATLCPGGVCDPVPPTYNWATSTFPNDCGLVANPVNGPCPNSGFPGNDGDARYFAVKPNICGTVIPRSACATPAGLHVTDFKFKALAVPPTGGGVTMVAVDPCGNSPYKTMVTSILTPPSGYTTDDVLKTIGPAAPVRVVSCDDNGDCDDGDFCTTDACLNNACSHTLNLCSDPNPCTFDYCAAGACHHDPICQSPQVCYLGECFDACSTAAQCDDGVACTVDVCDTTPPAPIDGVCRNNPDDGFCDTGEFCSAKVCDPQSPGEGCVFDHACWLPGSPGNPCPTDSTCQEATDSCGGCFAPAAVGTGSRYIAVTPADQGTTPIALAIKGICDDQQTYCVDRYVQSKCLGGPNNGLGCTTNADCPRVCSGGLNPGQTCATDAQCPLGVCVGICQTGTLGATPVYKTSAQWGTVQLRGSQIRPDKEYFFHAQCNFGAGQIVRSAATVGRTWEWGDVDGDGDHDAIDVANTVNAFKNLPGAPPIQQSNVWGCNPDPEVVDALDIVQIVDALKGFAYPCALVCP